MPVSKKSAVSLGYLAETIGFPIRLVQVAIFKDFAHAMGEVGLTPAIYSVLEVLRANPGITQSKLAAIVKLDRSSVVPMLDKLEKRGVVTRRASTTDRRHNHITLTDEGMQLVKRATECVRVHNERFISPLTAQELDTLIALLKKLTANRP